MNDMKIQISFRQSEKDIYDIVCTHSSKSGFIKDVLKEHLKDELSSIESARNKK